MTKNQPNRRSRLVRSLAVLLVAGGAIFAMAQFNQAQTTPTTPTTVTSGRSPVISDQFSSTSGSALQARAPGIQVQQGIAAASGTSEFLVGDATSPQDWLPETITLIIQEIFDQISQILSGLNLLVGGNPLSGLLGGSGTGGLGSLFGGLTGGTGSIPIS
ncbi:MAG: hypothetical protein H6818_13620 [Phycisphaerales bacterium]|nr:hypothetical protein [Phycisphaerales bacterium]MCB9862159.1 hypothetical protein [Phycisphaerales bacterium]